MKIFAIVCRYHHLSMRYFHILDVFNRFYCTENMCDNVSLFCYVLANFSQCKFSEISISKHCAELYIAWCSTLSIPYSISIKITCQRWIEIVRECGIILHWYGWKWLGLKLLRLSFIVDLDIHWSLKHYAHLYVYYSRIFSFLFILFYFYPNDTEHHSIWKISDIFLHIHRWCCVCLCRTLRFSFVHFRHIGFSQCSLV